MSRKARLFVEGKSDKKFFKDYLKYLTGNKNIEDMDIINLGGWTNIPKASNKFQENSDSGGINLLIIDANYNISKREEDVKKLKDKHNLEFDLFLLPNNEDSGNLETLLCKIINKEHKKIFGCFDKYQKCLKNSNSNYTIPDLKSKIYAFLEALLPKKKNDMIKVTKRDYTNKNHWNLDSLHLNSLKKFLISENYSFY